MATVTYIKEAKQHISAMRAVIRYCQREDKTTDPKNGRRYVTGLNCDGPNACTEFLATKTAWNKLDGINFYQYVQSFSPKEKITHEQAHAVGLEFAAKAWPGHEVQVTTHCDTEHIHTHFIINSVSFETGKKLHQTPTTLRQLRQISDEICMAHNLSVLPSYKRGGKKMTAREYRAARKGQSWKFRLMYHINEAMKVSVSREDYIRQMKHRGYGVWWSDERKYITYTCPNGMKCRCNKLHDDKYLKARLEDEFELRERLLHVPGGSGEHERGSHGAPERGAVPAHRLRGTPGMADELEDPAGERGAVPAHPVPADHAPGDQGRTGESAGEDARRCGSGEAGGGEKPERIEGTGWEKERDFLLRSVQNLRRGGQKAAGRVRQTAEEKSAVYGDHRGGIGGAVGAGVRLASALGRLTDDDSEDEEERQRKQEAAQAASNAGALMGLAIGAISALAEDDLSLARKTDEELTIEEEEDFNEFLARMDEEYGYEEEQQMM